MTERRRESLVPNDIFAPYRLTPLVKTTIVQSSQEYWEERERENQNLGETLTNLYGPGAKPPFRFSPSTSSTCLRREAYQALGYKRIPRSFESEMALQVGSSVHYVMLRPLRRYGWQEQAFVTEDPPMSGRVDFLFYNSALDEWQILDLKVTSVIGLKQRQRENMPNYLKPVKNIYPPTPEARKQMLLYMWALREQGKNVTCGNIIYIDRDQFKIKESIIPWDAMAEDDLDSLLSQMRSTHGQINNLLDLQARGECILEKDLPDGTVDPETAHYICGFCDYRAFCEAGRIFAAAKEKKAQKRRDPQVYQAIKRQLKETEKKVQEAGFNQPRLFD